MRDVPLNFLSEKNKLQYKLIDLITMEASHVYMAYAQDDSTTTEIVVDDTVKELLNESGYNFIDSGEGYCWTASFEDGINVGALRQIIDYDDTDGVFTLSVPLDETPVTDSDRIRIAKNIFLTNRNTPVDFYLPDESYGEDVEIKYMPFPMSITPIGTNSKGEVMTLDVALSSVDKVISNAILLAEGLQSNRVNHLRVFSNTLDQGKEYCMKDSSYIDTVTIDNTQIKFSLESKYNIVDVQIPQRIYTRDFCGFRFKSASCGWTTSVGTYVRKNAEGDTVLHYPEYDPNTCDHTLYGANGCQAHNNTRRFGAFPALAK